MRKPRWKKFLWWFLVISSLLCGVVGLSCHECGNMYDGTEFMGIKDYEECQFFEHDISQNHNQFLKECPPQDKCCFALREHMDIEFWGHAAAAEVFVRGCCSSLNKTPHHLASSEPPPLVMTQLYKAEIMSQTIQTADIKTRVLFCNTLGCNNKRIPWSEVVQPDINPIVRSSNRREAFESQDNMDTSPPDLRRQVFSEEQGLLALLEETRKLQGRRINSNEFVEELLRTSAAVEEEATKPTHNRSETTTTVSSLARLPQVCECNCNCPALVCPNFQLSRGSSRNQSWSLDIAIFIVIANAILLSNKITLCY